MADTNKKLLFQLIAADDPRFAVGICQKYGYTVPPVRNPRELGALLQELVTIEGEKAFIDIMDHHPHKDLILEMYCPDQPSKEMMGADGSKSGCGCDGAKSKCGCSCSKKCGCQEKFSNITGPEQNTNQNQTTHHITSTQTGVVILSCAVIIALAIMSKK